MLTARNIVCHGFATLIELLFMSFGEVDDTNDPWFDEYLSGAGLEVYYVPMHFEFISAMCFDWTLFVEGLYLEYGVMMIGVCNIQEQIISLNPGKLEMSAFNSPADFFAKYNVGIIIAGESAMASAVSDGMSDKHIVTRMEAKIVECEKAFVCRVGSNPSRLRESHPHSSSPGSAGSLPLTARTRTVNQALQSLGHEGVSNESLSNLNRINLRDIKTASDIISEHSAKVTFLDPIPV